MKEERIRQLNEELKNKTGVDFSTYRNEELTETVSNALTFPLYFGRCISQPVLALLGLNLLLIIVVDSGYMKTFMGFPGFPLALVNGILLGLVLFIRRVRADMGKVFNISADLSLQAVKDIAAARSRVQQGGKFPSLLEIFQGMNAIVVLPVVMRIVEKKVPFLGGLVSRIVGGFFNRVDRRLAARAKARNSAVDEHARPLTAEQVANWLGTAEKLVENGKGLINQVVDKVGKVVAFPFLTIFTIVFTLTLALYYGAYAFMG